MPRQDSLVGIDLGTTMSVIARLTAAGAAETIPNRAGEPLTPSVIYIDGNTALVGRAAREAAGLDCSRAAMFVKREMGCTYYSREVAGRQFRPETLSAIILRKLKLDAEKRIGPISKAVITVPAFFDDTRRKATEDAGRMAGLEVLDIINEPTAAALAYAMHGEHQRGGPRRIGVASAGDFPGQSAAAVVADRAQAAPIVLQVRHGHRQQSDALSELRAPAGRARVITQHHRLGRTKDPISLCVSAPRRAPA